MIAGGKPTGMCMHLRWRFLLWGQSPMAQSASNLKKKRKKSALAKGDLLALPVARCQRSMHANFQRAIPPYKLLPSYYLQSFSEVLMAEWLTIFILRRDLKLYSLLILLL